MGLLTEEELREDSVVGGLTAENVFNRWKKYIDVYKGANSNDN